MQNDAHRARSEGRGVSPADSCAMIGLGPGDVEQAMKVGISVGFDPVRRFFAVAAVLGATGCGGSDTGPARAPLAGANGSSGSRGAGSVDAGPGIAGGVVSGQTPGGGLNAGMAVDAGPPCVNLQCKR